MFPYLPATSQDENYILKCLSLQSADEVFKDIPDSVRLKRDLKLDDPKSELEVERILKHLSEQNVDADKAAVFLGAGIYDHYIPAAVRYVLSRSEFYTAYTPYQPEISQGTLQAIFEYQTMICSLTGMDAANASLYDGSSAAAEAVFMAVDTVRRRQVLVSETVHPDTRRVLSTYMGFHGLDMVVIPMKDGVTDIEALKNAVSKDTAAVLIQTPNFLGYLEDIEEYEVLLDYL